MEPLIFQADQTIYCDAKHKWFDHYIPVIPTDVIIHKTIPGFGATTTEIKAERNSIIVLPNVATILNKHQTHKDEHNTFAVYEGISSKNTADYLLKEQRYKKILTTPESLAKVIKAFELAKIDALKNYFMLMDECHKYIQDVRYRPNITLAFDIFFRFINKAMISSTPIRPSDPRFAGFKYLKLQPTYEYFNNVELLYNNNEQFALKSIFERNPHVKQCIFFNSIEGIIDIIKKHGIGDESIVFCSKESAQYIQTDRMLRSQSLNAVNKFEAGLMKQYNFFTSSLFNGLDIILDEAPQVIMISIFNDPKTYLDPFTDVIQILGRFRKNKTNKLGYYAEAVHLLPIKSKGNQKNKQEVTQWLSANRNAYDTILTLMYSNTSSKEAEVYKDALRRLPFNNFLANDTHLSVHSPFKAASEMELASTRYDLDYFKIDNLYEEERVNCYYSNPNELLAAYKNAGNINIQNAKLRSFEVFINETASPVDRQEKLNARNGKRYSKETIKQLVYLLMELDGISGNFDIYDDAVYNLTKHAPLVRKAFDKLGPKVMADVNYSITKIRKLLIDYDVKAGKNSHPVIDMVNLTFFLGVRIPIATIKKKLQQIYDDCEIKTIAKATDLYQWFEIKETKFVAKLNSKEKSNIKESKEQRAFILLSRKFNTHRFLERT